MNHGCWWPMVNSEETGEEYIGLVLARGFRVVEIRRFGVRVRNGNSTALEWLGNSEILSLTSQLRGRKILVADSAAGAFHLGGHSCPFWKHGQQVASGRNEKMAGRKVLFPRDTEPTAGRRAIKRLFEPNHSETTARKTAKPQSDVRKPQIPRKKSVRCQKTVAFPP